jgi:hypothetical protein
VSTWAQIFLGVIAVATLTMAIAQVGIFVAAGLLARRLGRLAGDVHTELKPIFGHLDAIGRDASRASALALAQVERVDRVCNDVAGRLEQTMGAVSSGVGAPLREWRAFMSGLQAAFAAIRDSRGRPRDGRGREDEDALFI